MTIALCLSFCGNADRTVLRLWSLQAYDEDGQLRC